MAVFAHRRALGAVRAEVERVVEGRLLSGPDAVLDLGDDAAADRAVGTDGAYFLRLAGAALGRGLGALHHPRRKPGGQRGTTGENAGMAQEVAPVESDPRAVGLLLRLGGYGR